MHATRSRFAPRLGLSLLLTLSSGCHLFAQSDPAAEREIPTFVIPPARPGVDYERFIVFGDWGTGRDDQRRVADAMAERIRSEQARLAEGEETALDFLLTTGDNFYPAGVSSADDPQWKEKFEEVYDAPELRDAPVFASLGNHDHAGNAQAQLAYARKNPRWRMPARYYTVTRPLGEGRTLALFVLDTQPLTFRSGDPEQLEWLDAELAKSEATWKLVVGHHPLYSHTARGFNHTLIRRLEPLLVRHRVDIYVAGHDHILDLVRPVRGVYHLVSGAAGGPDKAYGASWTEESFYTATLGGFCYLRAGPQQLVIEFVRMNGETEYAHVLYRGRTGPF